MLEPAERSGMASLHGLRVVCDLSDFFSDIRRKLLIYVDPSKDRCVADLVARVKTLTGLLEHPNIVLAIGDCLLPMTEDIRILHQEDILKVINSGTNENEFNPEIRIKKRKDKKRKKKKVSESESLQIEESVNNSEVDITASVTEISNTTEVVDPILPVTTSTSTSSHMPANLDDSLGETGPSVKKRKRIRIRHRRKFAERNNVPVPALDYSLDMSVGDLQMRPLVKVVKPDFYYSPSNQKHIRFLDDSENKTDEMSHGGSPDFSDKLLAGSDRESIVTPQNEVSASAPKATQWDVKQHPTLINNRESMKNGNQAEGTNHMFSKLLALANSTPLVVKHSRPPIAEVKPVSVASAPLQGLPKAGDILTFTILRMDESYCPQLSNPITAKVLLYSEATNEVSLDILDGRDQCQQPKGKFDIETDEEELGRPQSSVIQLNWQEIMEPHLNIF